MKRYYGGEKVKGGFYFSFKDKDLITVEKDSGILPGEDTDAYFKVPLLVMLTAGPLIGLVYVIFLPFIAFAMVLSVAAKKVWGAARWTGYWLLQAATASWRPGVAYLAWWKHSAKNKEQKNAAESKTPETPVADTLTEMEKEIAGRRNEEHEEKGK